MAHTPGPWAINFDSEDHELPLEIVTCDDKDHRIAFPASDGNPDDARLIAAAPDLLAALKEILPWHDSHPVEATKNRIINLCRAAIVKAEAA